MRRPSLPVAVLVLALSLAGTTGMPLPVAASSPEGGPGLTEAGAALRSATSCQPRDELREARRVVLLVAGTGSTPEESWSWSYEPALRADGFATCTVQIVSRFTTGLLDPRRWVTAAPPVPAYARPWVS